MGEEPHNSKDKRKHTIVKKTSSLHDLVGSTVAHHSKSPRLSMVSHVNSVFSFLQSDTDPEEELRVIDMDVASLSSGAATPIEFTFPMERDSKTTSSNLRRHKSSTDVTKILIDQKAQFTDLRISRKRRKAIDFTAVLESDDDESDTSDEDPRFSFNSVTPVDSIDTVQEEKSDHSVLVNDKIVKN